MKQTLKAYHFTNDKLRDGSPIPRKRIWLRHKGDVIPCQSGLHASLHPFDALKYAPGHFLHLVEVRGEIQKHGNDKIVGRERRIVKTINAEKILRDFARWNALQVLPLWPDAPEVVVKFLKTGDESLRATAWAAASAATWAATRTAASAATWAATRTAASAAASAAGWSAALDAERDTARDAFIQKSRRKFAQMVKQALK